MTEINCVEMLIWLHCCTRCKDVALRKEYVKLVDSVRESGGEVKIFSSMHISGERTLNSRLEYFIFLYSFCFTELEQLTGVAAILRFPMPELEEDNDSDEE